MEPNILETKILSLTPDQASENYNTSLNESDNNDGSEEQNSNGSNEESSLYEESDEEEEEEPKLKYTRLSNAVFDDNIKGDAVSTATVGDNHLIIGTHGGQVLIMDLEGNLIASHVCHTASVTSLSLDSTSQYVASSSDDGTMVINGITQRSRQVKDFKRPIKAIAFSPDFATASHQRIAAGGLAGHLIINEKGWWGYRDTILQSGDGPILEIQWHGDLIAWASDSGVKIYDINTQQRVGFVGRNSDAPRADLYPCHLRWLNSGVPGTCTLLVGWANMVKVAHIKLQGKGSLHPHIQSQISAVEITNIINTDFLVCGLAPLNEQLVLLAHLSSDGEENEQKVTTSQPSRPPEIRIVDLKDDLTIADILTVRGFEHFKVNDYKLVVTAMGDLFYIISPKDIITAKKRDLDDRIEWRLEMGHFEEALKLLQFLPIDEVSKRYSIPMVGKLYMEHLLAEADYDKVAELCPEILVDDVAQWENWVFAFAEIGRLNAIVPYIPTRKPTLSSTVYEMILAYFLASDRNKFFATLRSWPSTLYSLPAIIEAALDALEKDSPRDPLLLESIAELYQLNRQPEKALEYFLELRNPLIFRLIQEFNLYSSIRDRVVSLMEFDLSQYSSPALYQQEDVRITSEGRAVGLLIRNTDSIPVSSVVNQLHNQPLFLHIYLHALFTRDSTLGSPYHDIQVELYAEYDYDLLLNFLRTSNDYSLEKAYRVCDLRDLVPEMIFVLGRMGNHHKALHLIIQRLEDVEQAIDYAKEHDDEELWDDLLKYSNDKPAFLKGLLESAGSHLAPARVIRAIPNGLEIPGLKASIIQTLQDYNLQMSLRRGCEKVLNRDRNTLSQKLKRYQKRAITPSLDCQACHLPLNINKKQVTVVFFCQHTYHQDCLLPAVTSEDVNLASVLPGYNNVFPESSVLPTFQHPDETDTSAIDLIASKLEYSFLVMGKKTTPQCPRCRDLQAENEVHTTKYGNGHGTARFRWNWASVALKQSSKLDILNQETFTSNNSSQEDSDLPPMIPFN